MNDRRELRAGSPSKHRAALSGAALGLMGLLVVSLVRLAAAQEAESGPKLKAVRDAKDHVVRVDVVGLSREDSAALGSDLDAAGRWLSVTVVDPARPVADDSKPRPAVAGGYLLEPGVLHFSPKYPFREGLSYRARFRTPDGRTANLDFTMPAPPPSEPGRVVGVYPSAKEIPENTLRFYLHFSKPMSRGEVYDRLQLLDKSGRALELPFLELGEELWDASGTRLTLLMDPGRIKRGVRPRDEFGTSLKAGESYTLVVDSSWPDAEGKPLAEAFEQSFRVSPPVEKAIDVDEWKMQAPAVGSRAALVVLFPRSLDHALALRTLDVLDASGAPLKGTAKLSDGERRWEFTPEQPWANAEHTFFAGAVLEDPAGNRLGVPFEQLSKTPDAAPGDDTNFRPDVAKPARIAFTPGAATSSR